MYCFYDAVTGFFKAAYNYYKNWLLLDTLFLKHCQFMNFEDRYKGAFDDVTETITLTKNLYDLVLENPNQLNLLEDGFPKNQSIIEKDNLNVIWKSAAIRGKHRNMPSYVYHLGLPSKANGPTWQNWFICTYYSRQ